MSNAVPTKDEVLNVIASMTRYHCAAPDGDYGAGMEPSLDGDYIHAEDTLRAVIALYETASSKESK